jgi:hypothetical protein
MVRPSPMENEKLFNMTQVPKRLEKHPYDKLIVAEGHSPLRIGFLQAKHKISKHGAIHALTYTLKQNNTTKTEKTEENILTMMESIQNMTNRPNTIWFYDETTFYQKITERGFGAIYIFDDDKKIVAVLKKKQEIFYNLFVDRNTNN